MRADERGTGGDLTGVDNLHKAARGRLHGGVRKRVHDIGGITRKHGIAQFFDDLRAELGFERLDGQFKHRRVRDACSCDNLRRQGP